MSKIDPFPLFQMHSPPRPLKSPVLILVHFDLYPVWSILRHKSAPSVSPAQLHTQISAFANDRGRPNDRSQTNATTPTEMGYGHSSRSVPNPRLPSVTSIRQISPRL